MNIPVKYLVLFSIALLFFSCKEEYTPKPRGYMKVDYPEKQYRPFESKAPFTFDYPIYSNLEPDTLKNAEPWWYNMVFEKLNGTFYLSYKKVDDNLSTFISDSRTLAYKHSIKADAINESLVSLPNNKVYGIIYDLKGNTASSLQFFLTDSSSHFIRGSLYFNTTPDKDSLAPVVDFIREDLVHLINTFQWK